MTTQVAENDSPIKESIKITPAATTKVLSHVFWTRRKGIVTAVIAKIFMAQID